MKIIIIEEDRPAGSTKKCESEKILHLLRCRCDYTQNNEEYTHNELLKKCFEMLNSGNQFEVALGNACMIAGFTNRKRLIEAFPEFFKKKK